VLASWGIALSSTFYRSPATCIGYGTASAYELKVLQALIIVAVAIAFR
jgi:uncharacterized protein (DUF486 family)